MTYWRSFGWRWATLFLVLFVGIFEFYYDFLPSPYAFFGVFFQDVLSQDGMPISSDTSALYIGTGFAVLVAACAAILWSKVHKVNNDTLKYWAQTAIVYYLSLQLFEYGWDKVFKAQFFLPEPNILHTELGGLSKDILYWSTMGSSWGYSFFLGLVEVITAGLLLFRRSRALGVLMSIGVFVNVLMVNISFDISVKLYASILLLFSCVAFMPYLKSFIAFVGQVPENKQVFKMYSFAKKRAYICAKGLVILAFLLEGLGPFVISGKWNDDAVERPIFHGAYAVEKFEVNGQEIQPTLNAPDRWRRIFVHRKGYLIVENMKGQKQDFKINHLQNDGQLKFERYDLKKHYVFSYSSNEGKLVQLHGIMDHLVIELELIPLAWEEMPLIQSGFHWTINHD